jgi:predicted  nucleic acid-binding Zn-ribbon protein
MHSKIAEWTNQEITSLKERRDELEADIEGLRMDLIELEKQVEGTRADLIELEKQVEIGKPIAQYLKAVGR